MSPTRMSTLRVTAGAAALTIAGVGVLVAPGHATEPTAHATSISIRALHAKVQPGGSDTITGDLTVKGVGDLTGRQVTLEAKSDGQTGFTPVGVATAGPKGGIHLTVTPGATTKYRWDYAGDTDARARLSAVVTVRIATSTGGQPSRLPTTLSIRAVHARVDAAGNDVVKGRLRSRSTELPHRTVILLSRTQGQTGWTYVGADSSDKNGELVFTVHPATATAYQLQFPGTEVFRPSHSGVARVLVRPSVSIAASSVAIDPGATTSLSGVVTYQGAPVVGGTVSLLARNAGTSQDFHVVTTGVTLADGSVTLTDAPTVNTKYRLRLEHTTDVPEAVSPALLVSVTKSSSLSIRGRSTSAGYVVAGSLRGGGGAIAGATVSLMAEAPGATSFTEAGMAVTTKNGLVKFTEPEAAGTTYELVFAGGPHFAGSHSGTVVD